jgi:hypothetical protein
VCISLGVFELRKSLQEVSVFIIFSSFETKLPEIFENLNETFQAVKTRMKAEQFRVTTFLNCYIMLVSFNFDPFHVDKI